MGNLKKVLLFLLVFGLSATSAFPNHFINAEESKKEENPILETPPKEEKTTKMVQQKSLGFATYGGIDLNGATDRISKTIHEAISSMTTLNVQATFSGAGNVTDRKIEMKIENGLYFDTLPGMTKQGNTFVFDAASLPQQLQGIVTNATFTPNAAIYNEISLSGILTYYISAGATNVNLELGTFFDNRFTINYGNYVLNNLINVKSFESTNNVEAVIDNQFLEEYELTTQRNFWVFNQAGDQVLAAPNQSKSQILHMWAHDGTHVLTYIAKQFEISIAFSKQVGVQGVTKTYAMNNNMNVSIDRTSSTTEDIMTITLNDIGSLGNVDINYLIPANAIQGSYTPRYVSSSYKLFNSDISVPTNPAFGMMPITIVGISNNLLTVGDMLGNDVSPASIKTDNNIQTLGGIMMRNDNADELTSKKIRLTFDDVNIGVRAANLVFGSQGKAFNVIVKTNKGNTYNVGDLNHMSGIGDIGTTILNLENISGTTRDEYITELTYETGTFAGGASSKAYGIFQTESNKVAMYYYGDFIGTTTPTQISAKIDIIEATEDFATATIQTSHRAMMNVTQEKDFWFHSLTWVNWDGYPPAHYAGTTQSMQIKLAGAAGYRYSSQVVNMIQGIEVYLREDKYFKIDRSTIKVVDENGVTLTEGNGITILETVDNTNARVFKVIASTVKLGKYYTNLSYPYVHVMYDLKIRSNAPTTSIQFADMYFIKPIKPMNVIHAGYATNEVNKFNVDGSGDLTKYLGAGNTDSSFKIQAQKDFTVTSAANLNNGAWGSYDYATGQKIINLNPSGEAKYQLNVSNNSGDTITGYVALIPIPKAGESTPLMPANPNDFDPSIHLQKNAFEWTTGVESEIILTGAHNYTVLYATNYETEKDSINWKTWAEISDKTQIRMVRVETTDVITDGTSDAINFKLSLTDPNADTNSGKTNIYSSRIYRSVLGTAGYKPSEPIAIRLKTGAVKGQVFADANRDGVKNGIDVGVPNVIVLAYETGTTTLIDSTITTVDGTYEFLGLEKTQNVDIVFTNPSTNDETRFNTPTPAADNLTATYTNIAPSGVGYDSRNASLILPFTVTLDAGSGVVNPSTIIKYLNETMIEPAATKSGYELEGWYTEPTFTNKVIFPYTVTADTTLYAKYKSATLSGKVFDDKDCDTLDDDLKVVIGVTVKILDATTKSVIATTTSDASGNYSFNMNEIIEFPTYTGSYVISIDLPATYVISNKSIDSIINASTLESDPKTDVNTSVNNNIGVSEDAEITVNPVSHTIYVGDTVQSDIIITNGSIDSFTWSDGTVASHTTNLTGVQITALTPGTSTLDITVLDGYGNKSTITKQISVTVVGAPTLTAPKNISLEVNETKSITSTFSPSTATLTYSSSDTTKVSVDTAGNVTGLAKGSSIVTVTLTTADGLKVITYDIIVTVGEDVVINETNKEAISGHDFTLKVSEVATLTEAIVLTKSEASAWSIEQATLNQARTLTVTHAILPQKGSYAIILTTALGSTKTVYAHVGDDVVINETNKEAISGHDFTLTVAEVASLTESIVLTKTEASAWSIEQATLNEARTVTATHSILPQKGSYAITLTTTLGTTKTVYAHVGDDVVINETNKEAISGHDFNLSAKEVLTLTNADVLAKTEAAAWSTDPTTLNKARTVSATYTILPVKGSYAITLRTTLGTTKTVYAHVGDDLIVNPAIKEAISGHDFNLTVLEVSSLTESIVLTKSEAKAWSINPLTLNQAVVVSATYTILPVKGSYKVTLKTAAGVTEDIYAHVGDDPIIDETNKEAVSGHDFTIKVSEVSSLTESIVLSKSEAKAWSTDPLTLNQERTLSATYNVLPKKGSYAVELKTQLGSTKTIYIHVGDNVIINPINKEAISGINFNLTIDEVNEILKNSRSRALSLGVQKLIEKAQVTAWSTDPATLNELRDITSVEHSLQAIEGTYKITYKTALGTTLELYATVGNNVINENGEALNANNFTIKVSEVASLNNQKIIEKSNAKAWSTNVQTLNQIISNISIEHNIRAVVGDYALTFKTPNQTSLTVTVKVINDDTGLVQTGFNSMIITYITFLSLLSFTLLLVLRKRKN